MFYVIGKKCCLFICVCVMVGGLILGGIISKMLYKKTFGIGTSEEMTVLIDAGHGYPDGGAVGITGLVEADVNLNLSKKVAEIFEGKGIKTIMTREKEGGVRAEGAEVWRKIDDMKIRQKMVRESDADLFLSLHMNHFTSKNVHGLRLFYAQNHKEIKPLAEDIQKSMSEITGAKVTAVRSADKGLFLLKSPSMPAILIECGFLSNPDEEKKLSDDEYLSKIAWAIAETVEKHYRAENV